MTAQDRPGIDVSEVIDSSRAIENAVHDLCRATMASSAPAPADFDVVLVRLAAAAGALPQAARQLSDNLDQARHSHRLAMDDLTDATEPDTARALLDATREPALLLDGHLDAAHQHTAHHVAKVGEELGAGPNPPRETSRGRRATGAGGAARSCAGDRRLPRTRSAEYGWGTSGDDFDASAVSESQTRLRP